jgi:septal ring factor EnvC (AmiA/AmiB activator)
MTDQRTIVTELLAADLREVEDLLPPGADDTDRTAQLLARTIEAFRRDETTWDAVAHRHDPETDAIKTELKRRETTALLVSMRARTIRSEIAMHALGERVRALQARHAEQRARAEALQASLRRLRRRIAAVESALAAPRGPVATPVPSASLLGRLWRRRG